MGNPAGSPKDEKPNVLPSDCRLFEKLKIAHAAQVTAITEMRSWIPLLSFMIVSC
jgi:hypothetical protein